MKRFFSFIILFTLLLLFVPLFLFFTHPTKKSIPSPSFFPTPTPVPLSQINTSSLHPINHAETASLFVTAVFPPDKTIHAPLNQQILLTFNKAFTKDRVQFFVKPAFQFSTSIEGNSLRIIPQQQLTEGTTYQFSVNITNDLPSPVFHFTTVGTIQPAQQDTFVNNAQESDKTIQTTHPDIFLSNKTPFSSSDFSVSSDFTDTPTSHFFFTVSLEGNQSISKQDFLSWVRQQGLTDQQISSLDIRYQ